MPGVVVLPMGTVVTLTCRPALRERRLASASVMSMTFGTFTVSGPLDTVIVTVLPTGTIPPEGFCEMTTPLATVSENASRVLVLQLGVDDGPARLVAALAHDVGRLRPSSRPWTRRRSPATPWPRSVPRPGSCLITLPSGTFVLYSWRPGHRLEARVAQYLERLALGLVDHAGHRHHLDALADDEIDRSALLEANARSGVLADHAAAPVPGR